MPDSQVSYIHIKGAREHNLRNVEVRIPRGKLVAVTGVSGSGKSSLVFDTLYAEGYRKYMESLSTRARQVLEQVKRPDVDFIHGLSPVLAIELRTAGDSPRSTVATITEIEDYARLLWAHGGEQFCPRDGGRVVQHSIATTVDRLLATESGSRLVLLAPLPVAKVSALRDEFPRLRQRGYQRVRIGGEIKSLDDTRLLPVGAREVTAEIVIDRIVLGEDQRARFTDSLELAFREGGDRAIALVAKAGTEDWREISLAQDLACEICGDVFEKPTPAHFSPNSPSGACPDCGGLGRAMRFDESLVVPDTDKSVRGGAIKPWRIGGRNSIIRNNATLKQLAEQLPFDPEVPWRKLPEETRNAILHGAGSRKFTFKFRRSQPAVEMEFAGVVPLLEEARRVSRSDGFRARLSTFQVAGDCPGCGGQKINRASAAVRVAGVNLPEFLANDVEGALGLVESTIDVAAKTHGEIVTGIRDRLRFLNIVGLGYLTLDRAYTTLSGGEAQRARLAGQLGMGLTGVIYVLDEPSVGLHPADNARLLDTLIELRDRGNSLIVVEHDEDTMLRADQLIELGPGAGTEGGELLFQGTPRECIEASASQSRTGPFLARKLSVMHESKRLAPDGRWLTVKGAREHNLANVTARLPVGLLTCVTGVSGSGKSTLVNDVLAAAAMRRLNGAKEIPGAHAGIDGLDHFEKCVRVDQSPIGRSPRSNPATFTKVFDQLRDLFSKTPLARVRGYKPSRFSFNVRGGRCERCLGDGQIRLDMLFMADAFADCPSCGGARYNRETLEIRFHGHTIADVLRMTVREALELFRNFPKVMEPLETMDAVGLGYLQLGQSALTLSGGEAQRLKLSLELSRRQQGRTLYVLDEPTTGLHWIDIQRLADLLFKLRDAGNTVIVIEHNLDLINLADWVIDLGPGGGRHGGRIQFEGTVASLADATGTATGRSVAAWLARAPARI
jgi:excinuclease ABC subunit A